MEKLNNETTLLMAKKMELESAGDVLTRIITQLLTKLTFLKHLAKPWAPWISEKIERLTKELNEATLNSNVFKK